MQKEFTIKNKRAEFAKKYIRGIGVELGPLHQPLEVPNNVCINYVDRLSLEQLFLHYPEVPKSEIIEPDIIDDAQDLKKIDNEKYDFCIANHVLEHMRDPIGALMNWFRILKPGGILYLSVPDIVNPLDFERDLTTLDHMIKDYSKRSEQDDYLHFIECAKYWNKVNDESEIKKIASKNFDMNYSIHFHTFTRVSIRELLLYISSNNKNLLKIVEYSENEINSTKEHIFIIEKDTYLDKIYELLKEIKETNQINEIQMDIIIPIYNAYEDLVKCLFSVLKFNSGYRIILINDKSSDLRIGEFFLDLFDLAPNNLVLLENNENLGFVKTVNIGIGYSRNDIILLNSDTIVTYDWANKLKKCAYSEDKIGTVTPFTNNGTICSIPKFCEPNQIPDGFTVDYFAEFVNHVSLRKYPELPTAVGFCMYIKRALIDEIGYFDEERFGKGYGEENDFCMRANKHGYKNILCDDTFIFHREGASFSDKKETLVKQNTKILSEIHPEYFPTVSQFCQTNPLAQLQNNIILRMPTYDIGSTKRKILFILHHLGGGVERHVMDLIESLNRHYVFFTMKVIGRQMILTEFNNKNQLNYVFLLPRALNRFELNNNGYKKSLEKIIDAFRIDIIHIHHLMGHTFDVFDIAKERGIPILFTVHDYYMICPRIYLLDEKESYCHEVNNINKCSICLHDTLDLPFNFINQWRDHFRKAIENSIQIIAPNRSVFEIINKYYYVNKSRFAVIEHGHKKELIRSATREYNNLKCNIELDKFNIAYIGELAVHKGSSLFYKMALSSKLKNKVNWHLIGFSDLLYNPGYYPKYNIYVYGKYNNFEQLKRLIKSARIDLAIFPAICPETFSFTLSEAWAAGIPVLVSNIGALEERVQRTGGGWISHVSNLGNFEEKILEIISCREDYQKKIDTVKNIKQKSINTMSYEYKVLYNKLIKELRPAHNAQFELSNLELLGTIADVGLTENTNIEHPTNIFSRFFRCINENGLRYTTKRITYHLKNLLIGHE